MAVRAQQNHDPDTSPHTCRGCRPTLQRVDADGDFDLDALARELAEISVGTAILGLRRVNITRRKLVHDVPALEPVVNAVLSQIEATVEPVSAVAGAAVSSLGDVIAGERGAQLHDAGILLATIGPELLRLSGLTRRD